MLHWFMYAEIITDSLIKTFFSAPVDNRCEMSEVISLHTTNVIAIPAVYDDLGVQTALYHVFLNDRRDYPYRRP